MWEGEGRRAHADLLLVSGEHVAVTEGIETPAVYFREELRVVVADVRDLVEGEYYGIVESHELSGVGGMSTGEELFPDL